DGREKSFCCFNAKLRDFAKIGRLCLKNGTWQDNQIVSADWIKASTTFQKEHKNRLYGLHWWLDTPLQSHEQAVNFLALGYKGQYLYVCPKKQLILIRIGNQYGNIAWQQKFKQLCHEF
ncbi:MAG: serine hydrolase, partial [Flavobacteriales bacterium]|nr:serine hydrolase [Flavobacteriales bacterium]